MEIVKAIRSLGLNAGETVLCHSSYKSFGCEVAGGPAGVGEALIQAVGNKGNVFMPTFNFAQLPWKEGETPSLTGVTTDRFWRIAGVLRSKHPTHPVAGWGSAADEVLAGHEQVHPFGAGSPIWKLWKKNAWVLQIGVEHSSNSTVHVGEEDNQLPYLVRKRVQKVWDGTQWTEVILRRPGDSNGFVKIGPILEQMGAVRECHVEKSRFRLMRQADVMRAVREMVTRNKAALLCDEPECDRCLEARQMIARADA